MRCPPNLFLAGLLSFAGLPQGVPAQEEPPDFGISLDSLLSMPVSTAATYEQRQIDAPAFVTIVTKEDIRRFGYRTLEEVIQAQVGFYSANDRQFTEIGFRGVGRTGNYNNKLLLLVDGHSINDDFTGGARVGPTMGIDLDAVDRIEIVRGPTSALYGARAMLAVVNLVTLKGRDLDRLEVMGELGTLGTRGVSARFGSVIGPDIDVAAAASWGSTDGEDLYFPELDLPGLNSGWARDLDWDRFLRALTTVRVGGLFLQASVATRETGIPTGAYGISFNHPDARSEDRNVFLEGRYEQSFSGATHISARGFFDYNENRGAYPFSDSQSGGGLTQKIAAGAESLGTQLKLQWDPSGVQRLVLGVEGQRIYRATQRVSPALENTSPVDEPYHILSAFFQDELQITPDLALTLGFRVDNYSNGRHATTPKGALVFHASPTTTFKLLAGEAFRAPNLLEMYVTYPQRALLGNPDLDPERVRSMEFVVDQRLGSLALTGVAFLSDFSDLIELVEVQVPDSLVSFGRYAFEHQNISNARSKGVDFEVRAGLPFGVMARAGYGYHHARDRATERELVNAPLHQFRLSASGGWDRIGEAGLNVRYESGRRTLYGNRTDPASMVDLTLNSRPFSERLHAQLIVKNLFGVDHGVPGGFQHAQSIIPLPGRRVNLRISLAW